MTNAIAFGVLCFSSLFTIIDPLAAAPIFVAVTGGSDARARRRTALRACAVALGLLVTFAVFGSLILRTFGVTINAFRIAGGLLFVGMALRMLAGGEKEQPADAGSAAADPAIVPLGMPIICGPGAMSTVMVLIGQTTSALDVVAFFVALVAVIVATALFLVVSPAALRLIGRSGVHVVTQVMGLIVCVIGIQFVIDGVRPVAIEILSSVR
jgi:multiple antibiotic resistance protein